MNEMMVAMGWDPVTYHGFIAANVAIFAAYGILGWRHFQRDDDSLEHFRYGMFILACGFGHLVMAAHMVLPLPLLMFASHAFTAVVSLWAAMSYRDS